MAGQLITRREGTTGYIIFSNVEKHNAVNFDMWKALPDAVAAYNADPEVRAILVMGDGDKAFISGADISEFEKRRGSADASAEYNHAGDVAANTLAASKKPTIAKIRGICFGGGVGVALCCHIRICSDDSRFCVPAARLGLGYAYTGLKRLIDVVGPSFAAEIFATARRYSAAEALQMKLVNRSVPAADLDRVANEYLTSIGENAPMTVAAALIAIREAMKPSGERDLNAVQAMVDACFASEDYIEGRRAFTEKRKPAFKGR